MLPAAFDGIDPAALVTGARASANKALLLRELPIRPSRWRWGYSLALLPGQARGGPLGLRARCHLLTLWLQQLFGESLGRRLGEGLGAARVGPLSAGLPGQRRTSTPCCSSLLMAAYRWVLMLTADSAGPAFAQARSFAGLPLAHSMRAWFSRLSGRHRAGADGGGAFRHAITWAEADASSLGKRSSCS